MMNDNIKLNLPKETKNEIEIAAKIYSEKKLEDFNGKRYLHLKTISFYSYIAGASTYANNIHVLNQENIQLKNLVSVFRNALTVISNEGFIVGVAGAKWKESEFDSLSVAAGYNQALKNLTLKAKKALAETGEDPDLFFTGTDY